MTSNKKRLQIIRQRLEQQLQPEQLTVIDQSHLHIGHEGARDGRGHFKVTITAAVFDGKTTMQCHRMVYATLKDLMTTDIHALSIYTEAKSDKT